MFNDENVVENYFKKNQTLKIQSKNCLQYIMDDLWWVFVTLDFSKRSKNGQKLGKQSENNIYKKWYNMFTFLKAWFTKFTKKSHI